MKRVKTKRAIDKAVIQALVRRFDSLSRVEINELTNIRRSTISQLVRELLKEGRLIEAGRAKNARGRKQVLLRINEEYGFIAGLEFDAELVSAAVMDLHPRIRASVKEPTVLNRGIEGLVEQLLSCTRRVIQQAGLEPRSLMGIGIVDPGIIDSQEGISVMSSTIDFWKQVPTRKIFEDNLGIRAVMGNSSRCKAVAERVLGTEETADNMIYVEYSRGIGAGVVMGGKILEGHRSSAGELGHIQAIESGPACKCGGFGCLEAVAGASALEARIRTSVEAGSNSRVLALAEGDASKITAWNVLEAAGMADKTCSTIVEEMGNVLACGLATLVNLFNPSLIVLDKHLALAGPQFLDQLSRIIKRQALDYATECLTLRFGKLGSEGGVLGAALLVLEKHFEIPPFRALRFAVEPGSAPLVRTSTSSGRT